MTNATATRTASPTKLRSGEWGARVNGTVREGDIVTITTRAGKTWDAEVVKVVWSGDGVAICATASLSRRPAPSRRHAAHTTHCGYPCPVTGRKCTYNDPCHDCF